MWSTTSSAPQSWLTTDSPPSVTIEHDGDVGAGGADQAAQVTGAREVLAAVDQQQIGLGRLEQGAALGGQDLHLVRQQREGRQHLGGRLKRAGEKQECTHGRVSSQRDETETRHRAPAGSTDGETIETCRTPAVLPRPMRRRSRSSRSVTGLPHEPLWGRPPRRSPSTVPPPSPRCATAHHPPPGRDRGADDLLGARRRPARRQGRPRRRRHRARRRRRAPPTLRRRLQSTGGLETARSPQPPVASRVEEAAQRRLETTAAGMPTPPHPLPPA